MDSKKILKQFERTEAAAALLQQEVSRMKDLLAVVSTPATTRKGPLTAEQKERLIFNRRKTAIK